MFTPRSPLKGPNLTLDRIARVLGVRDQLLLCICQGGVPALFSSCSLAHLGVDKAHKFRVPWVPLKPGGHSLASAPNSWLICPTK